MVSYTIPAVAWQIVLDTNVLFSGLRSRRGASHKLLNLIGKSPKFQINLSVPLILEYEEVLKREAGSLGLTHSDIEDVLNYLCSVGRKRNIHFLWRPYLDDPDDDHLLEVAVESNAAAIVTFNTRHFQGIESFGVRAMIPLEFLRTIGEAR